MKAENFNVSIPEGQNKVEVVLREVNDEVKKELPVLEPSKVEIAGQISAVFSFLEKRWNAEDKQIDHNKTHILVNRDNLNMKMIVNETDTRNAKTISGKIELSRQFKAFGINTEKEFEPEDLGNFFRINRSYYDGTKEECMQLVSTLKGFKATITAEVEREIKDNGSVTDVYKKIVNSNLPKSFFVKTPIFKGADPERIEVEIIATVSGRDIALSLISADAETIIEEVRDKLIDEQLDKIKELAPEIPIIEV